MANVSGRRQYSTRSTRIVPNVLDSVILVDENINDAAFLAFFNQVGKETTPTEKFQWDVDAYLATSDTVNGAISSTVTALVMDNGDRFIGGDLIQNKTTGEVMYVSSVSTNTLTVVRGATAQNSEGGTAAAAIADGATIVKLAPAVAETSSRQTTLTTTHSAVYNYTQMFRWDLSMSDRQIKRQFENDGELSYETKKCFKEARMALNRAFLKGERGRWTQTTDLTTTEGISSAVSTYSWNVGGTLYEYAFDEFLVEQALRKGSRNKVMFASTNVILALSQMTKDRVEYSLPLGTKKAPVGIEVMEYKAPNGGTLSVVEDRFLTENFNGEAVICDMHSLKRKVFSNNGRDGELKIIADTNDVDDLGYVSTLYGDMGLYYGAEEHHAKLSGVTGGAKGLAVL